MSIFSMQPMERLTHDTVDIPEDTFVSPESLAAQTLHTIAMGRIAILEEAGQPLSSGTEFSVPISPDVAQIGARDLRTEMALHKTPGDPLLVEISTEEDGPVAQFISI